MSVFFPKPLDSLATGWWSFRLNFERYGHIKFNWSQHFHLFFKQMVWSDKQLNWPLLFRNWVYFYFLLFQSRTLLDLGVLIFCSKTYSYLLLYWHTFVNFFLIVVQLELLALWLADSFSILSKTRSQTSWRFLAWAVIASGPFCRRNFTHNSKKYI